MALRCLLFTADEGTANPIRQILADLGIEGEYCAAAVDAAEKVTRELFQIVILDWDTQPEAGVVLKAGRERKASERPLALAVVSDDASAPQALQAGANSILRKPILINQVKDTLTTARDLLRAKQAGVQATAAAATARPSPPPASLPAASEKTLRAGEFLQSAPPAPSRQFETESDPSAFPDKALAEPVDALKNLEPMAAAVAEQAPVQPAPQRDSDEPRGLQWYLNKRAATQPPVPAPPSVPSVPSVAPAQANPELLGFEQMPSPSEPPPRAEEARWNESTPPDAPEQPIAPKWRSAQAQFSASGKESKNSARPSFRLGKGAMIGALTLAACAIASAPQAPWHAKMRTLWGRGRQSLHAWLNPQPVLTTPQAPITHEDFGRAGDEYKLPVAENIPDATTDPSQIRVTPVVDPTAKKTDGTEPAATPADASSASPSAQPSAGTAPGIQVQETPATVAPGQSGDAATASPSASGAAASSTPPGTPVAAQPHSDAPVTTPPPAVQPAPPKAQVRVVSTAANPPIPSSLTTQIASTVPEASGNKAPETALPSIEPVDVPEFAERALLAEQSPIAYPATARGQRGTVVLQVLIARDGTVQDAKFLQGSLAFARAAIDAVRQWKFKPYVMNGSPVSVTTKLTMTFQPES
jgi:TonB family protein